MKTATVARKNVFRLCRSSFPCRQFPSRFLSLLIRSPPKNRNTSAIYIVAKLKGANSTAKWRSPALSQLRYLFPLSYEICSLFFVHFRAKGERSGVNRESMKSCFPGNSWHNCAGRVHRKRATELIDARITGNWVIRLSAPFKAGGFITRNRDVFG